MNSIISLPDGKVIASGDMRFSNELFNDYALVRLLPNGTRDPSYYNSGLGGGRLKPWQNDTFYVGTSQTVRRILPTGYRDPSFIEMNLGPYFSSLQGGDYHVYPDGRVLISGAHLLNDPVRGFVGEYDLIWFSNTGYLDTTRIHRKGNGTVFNFALMPDGGFICSGTGTQFEGVPVGRIFRTDSLGVPVAEFQTGVFAGSAYGFLPLPDGRVYAGGRFRRSAAPTDTLLLARFMPDGSLDPSFITPQFSLGAFPVDFGKIVSCIYPWDEGKILVTGQFQYVNGQPRGSICMLDSTGAVLDAFDACGVGPYVWQSYTYASIERVVIDTTNNYLYVNGAYTGYSDGTLSDPLQRFVTRLHVGDITMGASTATAVPAFALFPNPSSGNVTLELEQVPNDAQVVVCDALGREVQRQRVSGHYTTLTLSHSGVYIVELLDENGRRATGRLVVE